jgi:hypothetical protein
MYDVKTVQRLIELRSQEQADLSQFYHHKNDFGKEMVKKR